MIAYSSRCLAALCLMLAWCGQGAPASAPPVRVVVSFSILDDIVRRIGGSEVVVTSLIGPDSDAHLFEPNPDQARLLAKAQLFVVNGLGFEGWLTRLTRSAQFGGVIVTATDGVAPITTTEPGETSPVPDPHAWQDPRNGIVYADNIARAARASRHCFSKTSRILGSSSNSREIPARFRARHSIPTPCRGQTGRPRPTSEWSNTTPPP